MNQQLSNKGISIQEARKVLGEDFSAYSDTEIESILEDLYFLANSVFDNN